ncbi:MAG TPA: 2-C-methyl-D-erythritol 4-phosphate cytidylyltransferase [Mycobacteriales bacterium]|nr:2-C-methyl-D-erythritol 4-phosphate cytidylyltransferase [Mycobacteriales bacterium]
MTEPAARLAAGAVGAIVAAGGRGERFGAGVPKALVRLAGEPLVVHACRALRAAGVGEVVVAAPAERVDEVAQLVAPARVVAGGATRTASVRRALATLSPGVEIVLVHDAARALAPPSLVERVVAAVAAGAPAVVPVLPVTDTMKSVDDAGVVTATVDRASLRVVQTPQGFRRNVLAAAHEAAHAALGDDADLSDDAGLVERAGGRVETVAGSGEALKVTTPVDLLVAEAVLRERATGGVRS